MEREQRIRQSVLASEHIHKILSSSLAFTIARNLLIQVSLFQTTLKNCFRPTQFPEKLTDRNCLNYLYRKIMVALHRCLKRFKKLGRQYYHSTNPSQSTS